MIIKYKKLISAAKTPLKVNDVDAGFDLYATSIQETEDFIEYRTGIAFEIPVGYAGFIFPRSSVTKYDLILKNSIGVIDATYRGEIKCRFYHTGINNGDIEYFSKIYDIGDRVVQIIFIKLPEINLVEAEELSETVRGTGGFGSTGQK